MNPLKTVLLAFFVLLSSGNVNARQYFDKNQDILLACFDLKPDEDDVMAAAALASMLNHPDLSGINYYAVAGAYGTQGGSFITSAIPDYYSNLFGVENQYWTNAHANWDSSVTRAREKVKPVLNAGGKLFVQEAGQSDFTYDLLQALINSGISPSVINSNVIVVQHSDWNEDQATQWKLNWVKTNTDYTKIADGNSNNATPQYNTKNTTWLNQAVSSGNPNALTRSFWTQAKNICENWNASWENPTIAAGGVDFSDCVENWWIFSIGADADNVSKFWDRYVINSQGTTPETINCSSLPTSFQSSNSIEVSVPYSVNQTRDINVALWEDNQWKSSGKKTVDAGSGNADITIAFSTPPATGNNYLFKVSLRPVGGDWTSNIDFCQSQNITVTPAVTSQTPYGGEAWSIPGTIESVNFDNGGEDIAYHDTTPDNAGNGPRQSESVDTEYKLPMGNIGWIAEGEWLEYTIDVAQAGNYSIELKVASIYNSGAFHIEFDGIDKSGVQNIGATGAWDAFDTYSISDIYLSAGVQVMRIYIDGGAFNLGTISFSEEAVAIENDAIVSHTLPTTITQNGTVTFTVDYEITDSRDIHVDLQNTDTWSGFGSTVATVEETGSGTATLTFTSTQNPPVDENFRWNLYMTPVGADWRQSVGNTVHQLVDIQAGTSLKAAAAKDEFSGEIDNFRVYPNPASSHITVTGLTDDSSNLIVYNAAGQLIYQKGMTESEQLHVEVGNWPEGIYLFRLTGNNQKKVLKLNVRH